MTSQPLNVMENLSVIPDPISTGVEMILPISDVDPEDPAMGEIYFNTTEWRFRIFIDQWGTVPIAWDPPVSK